MYAALTSYEALGTFIPGLAENRCLERHVDGCTLLQVWLRVACTAVHWVGSALCSLLLVGSDEPGFGFGWEPAVLPPVGQTTCCSCTGPDPVRFRSNPTGTLACRRGSRT